MRRSTRQVPAPRLRATASTAGSSCSSDASRLRYISGKATTAALSTVAGQLNTSSSPSRASGSPSGP